MNKLIEPTGNILRRRRKEVRTNDVCPKTPEYILLDQLRQARQLLGKAMGISMATAAVVYLMS